MMSTAAVMFLRRKRVMCLSLQSTEAYRPADRLASEVAKQCELRTGLVLICD